MTTTWCEVCRVPDSDCRCKMPTSAWKCERCGLWARLESHPDTHCDNRACDGLLIGPDRIGGKPGTYALICECPPRFDEENGTEIHRLDCHRHPWAQLALREFCDECQPAEEDYVVCSGCGLRNHNTRDPFWNCPDYPNCRASVPC